MHLVEIQADRQPLHVIDRGAASSGARHLRDLGREDVALRLLDALATLEADEPHERQLGAGGLAGLVEELLDGLAGDDDALLLEQESVVVPGKTIQQLLDEAGKAAGAKLSLVRFVRFERGEGIEKPQGDVFATEVAKMASA